MARANMNEMLRKRMSATQQASEQQTGDAAYEQIFQMPVPQTETQFRDVPICKLRPFFTADIGFHPYPRAKLEAFAEDESSGMNYLCETVEGGPHCTIRTEKEAGVGGLLIKNRITPEIAELFAGIPLNNGK